MKKLNFTITENTTIRKFLTNQGFTFTQITILFSNKDVKINGKRISKNCDLFLGDNIEIYFNETKKDIKIKKIFENDHVIIAVKPRGILTCKDEKTSSVEQSLDEILSAYPTHRLDRNTSGLVIFAKDKTTEQQLFEVFKKELCKKNYVCHTVGTTNFNNYLAKYYLFKDAKKSKVFLYKDEKKGTTLIKTKLTTLENKSNTSIVDCQILSGKTHQIRATLAKLLHPIIGDEKYGNGEINKKFHEHYQRLFCYKLEFSSLNYSNLQALSSKTFMVKRPNFFNKKNRTK